MEKIIWFNYEYKTNKEIFDFIFLENTLINYLIYAFLLVFLLYTIFYVWPKVLVYLDKVKKKKQILIKKKMLNRIKIQRDVEDEIEKELISK